MSEHEIQSLNTIAQKILDVLKKFQEQIMEALNNVKELPNMFKGVRDEINESTKRQISARGEMEIITRIANVESKKGLVGAEQIAIEDAKKQLQEDLDEVDKRYSNIQEDLNNEAKKRVRELDLHMFDLIDQFPKKMFDAYFDEYNSLIQSLERDAIDTCSERSNNMTNEINATCGEMEDFSSKREKFSSEIDDYKFNKSVNGYANYVLPIWVAEIENLDTRKIEKHYFLPGKFEVKRSIDGGSDYNIDIKTDEIFQNLEYLLSNTELHEKIDPLGVANPTKNKKRELQSALEKIVENRFNNNAGLKKAFSRVVEDSELLSIKGVKNG